MLIKEACARPSPAFVMVQKVNVTFQALSFCRAVQLIETFRATYYLLAWRLVIRTRYEPEGAMSLSQLFQCRTSGDHCSL